MFHLVLVDRYPQAQTARHHLPPERRDLPYLGIWTAPEPYEATVHVFTNEALAADLRRAGWNREDA